MPSYTSFLALWALAVGTSSSTPTTLAARQSTGSSSCSSLHIFLIRGYDETYEYEYQLKLVDVICAGQDATTGCDYEDVVYDTTISLTPTDCSGIELGRAAGVSQITAYNERCPDTKLVVSGFSEGAVVMGDILGGGTCGSGTAGLDVAAAPGNKICAATLWGDGRHVADQSYNVLNGSAYSANYPRSLNASSLAGLNTFSSVLRSYCHDTDQICAYSDGTPYVEEYHTDYFDLYSADAGAWIRDECSVTSPTATATATSTAPTSTSTSAAVCTAGTAAEGLADNFEELCEFTCMYGYCPDGVCTCTGTGTQITEPTITGEDGCPLDGESDGYDGLCSYSCNHGFCPSDACQAC